MADLRVCDLPRVMVGMPHAGPLHAEAYDSARTCCTNTNIDPELQVMPVGFQRANTGGLTLSFNLLLATALNMFADGRKATHFAMLHSDIEAEGYWLNVLWNEMRRHQLAVVSAVVAIKDRHKLNTSTAVGQIGNPWTVNRYIYVRERQTLPTTFTAKDVCGEGEELLINTGCMLIDLGSTPEIAAFWDGYAFRVNNRIVKDENGRYVDQFESEDWLMSRDLRKAGLPYGATWAVPTRHLSGSYWPNYED
jgi:hypothetical protein